ncbi:MAG TPA: hypothetical protein VI072_25120 [Polyangiaceae bacterium]
MSDKKGGHNKLIPQAVREALDSVVAPNVRDALLQEALSRSREGELPTDPERLRHFVAGPLKSSLVRVLGDELGESVVVELDRLATIASVSPGERRTRSGNLRAVVHQRRVAPPHRSITPSHRSSKSASLLRRSATPRPAAVRAISHSSPPPAQHRIGDLRESSRPPSPAPAHAPTIPVGKRTAQTAPSPPASMDYPRGTAAAFGIGVSAAPTRRLPFVLVATLDLNLVRKLAAWLDPRAAVVRVRSAASLLLDLENAADAPSVIVLDCAQPSIRPVALAALADDLPASIKVVLWGATSEIEAQVRKVLPAASRWISVSGAALAKDVAARCAELVC